MTYTVNIVANNRIWYDSRIAEDDPVVFQNVNYTTGNDRSVNIVRQRFLQDWARRSIPNSIREGIGLTDPAGASDEIAVTQGFAFVAGRFLDIPAGTFDASVEGLVGTNNYYLVIQVNSGTISEGDTRDPKAEVANLVGKILPYTKNHNELVIAKFRYDGVNIDQFEDYTAIQEWQASVLSPVSVIPGLTTGSDSILIRSGAEERINNLGIETDKTRFYLNAVFDDQDGSPVEEVKITNNDAVLEVTDLTNDDFLGVAMFDLSTGVNIGGTATQRIDSTGNLVNIGTINTFNIQASPGATGDFVDIVTAQTLSNKTITSGIFTGGAFSEPILDLPQINDTSDDHQYIFAVNELAADRTVTLPLLLSGDTFVFENFIQSLAFKTLTSNTLLNTFYTDSIGGSDVLTFPTSITDTLIGKLTTDTLQNKTLRTLIVQDTDQSNVGEIKMPALTGDKVYNITSTTTGDTFLFRATASNIDAVMTFTADNLLNVADGRWTAAQHTHIDANSAGTVSHDNLTGVSTSDHHTKYLLTNDLATTEITAIQNIDANVMSTTKWTNLAGIDDTIIAGEFNSLEGITGIIQSRLIVLEDLTALDSGNNTWQPMSFIGDYVDSSSFLASTNGGITNTGSTDMFLVYQLDLPTNRGSQELFVNAMDTELVDADSNDYITSLNLRGVTSSGFSTIRNDTTDRNDDTISYLDTFAAVNCGSFDKVYMLVACVNTGAAQLDISNVKVRYYYI